VKAPRGGALGLGLVLASLATAGVQAFPLSIEARAGENPISTGTTVAIGVTLVLGGMTGEATLIGADAASGSSEGSTDASRQLRRAPAEKRILAGAAIEDAARYFATGELGGVLPAALARLRELSPEARTQSEWR
jgi:hypothetical protein